MSTQANQTWPDSVPANHTFVASGVVDGIATWYEKTAALQSGWIVMTQSLRFPSKQGDPIRAQLKLKKPTTVTETINGVTYDKVIRNILINVDVIMPADSTATERADAAKYAGGTLVEIAAAGAFGYSLKNLDTIV